jgi:acetyl-CoA C-acetyltransferase
MRKVAIVGAGMTAFGEHFALGIKDLLPMAFADCARSVDKGLQKTDLQAAWFGAMGTTDGFPSGILADSLGLPQLPVTRVENSCATGNDAVRNALFGVASGAFDVALVMGADKLRDTTSADMLWEWEAMARDMAWDYPLGLVSPAGFALHVQRYLHESPATEEHLAMVAVKNHRHGVNNPKARLRFEITMEQAMAAPTVVTPFRLYRLRPAERRRGRAGPGRRRRGRSLHRPAGVGPRRWHRPGLGDASAQAGYDDILGDRAGRQAGLLHGRHDTERCRCCGSSRFFHRHRIDQL